MEVQTPQLTAGSEVPWASFWERVAARLLDLITFGCIAWTISGGVGAAWIMVSGMVIDPDTVLPVAIVSGSVYVLCWLGYRTVSLAWRGRTWGQAALGLALRRVDGKPLGWGRVLLRNVVEWVLFGILKYACLLGVGDVLPGAWATRKQTLHDRICGTEVRRVGTVSPRLWAWFLLGFLLLLGTVTEGILLSRWMTPVLNERRVARYGRQCRENLQALAEAAREYARDHDGFLPPEHQWTQSLRPYLDDLAALRCPADEEASGEAKDYSSYTMNPMLGRLRVEAVPKTTWLFEESWGEQPTPRHNGAAYRVNLTGQVESTRPNPPPLWMEPPPPTSARCVCLRVAQAPGSTSPTPKRQVSLRARGK